jgi:hypothetical protein
VEHGTVNCRTKGRHEHGGTNPSRRDYEYKSPRPGHILVRSEAESSDDGVCVCGDGLAQTRSVAVAAVSVSKDDATDTT